MKFLHFYHRLPSFHFAVVSAKSSGGPEETREIRFPPRQQILSLPWFEGLSRPIHATLPFPPSAPYLSLFQSPAVSGTHTTGNTKPPSDPSQYWRLGRWEGPGGPQGEGCGFQVPPSWAKLPLSFRPPGDYRRQEIEGREEGGEEEWGTSPIQILISGALLIWGPFYPQAKRGCWEGFHDRAGRGVPRQ